jgi:GGDEF domain-containing protein
VVAFSLSSEAQISLDAERVAWNLLLRKISIRLLQHLRPTDTLTRLSGWKYAVLLEELNDKDDIHLIIQRLEAILKAPFEIDGERYLFEVNFGEAVYDRNLQKPRELLDLAVRTLEQTTSENKASA